MILKKNKWGPVFLGLLLIFAACKTPPATGTASTAEDINGPADAQSLQQLADAKARAETARAKAEGVNAPGYFPEDWEAAESRYTAAGSAGDPASLGEARKQAAEWGAIADLYGDLYSRSLPRYVEDGKNELEAARLAAVASGVEAILPDRFGITDDLTASALDKLENGDSEGAIADGLEAYQRYAALALICEAYNLQKEADRHEFITYDPDNYEAGADAGNAAVDYFDAGSLAEARDNAGEARDKFGLVLQNGWIGYTNEKSAEAQEWRQSALEVKANTAVRDVYQNADKAYNQAFSALRAEDFQAAADLFERSGDLFRESRDTAVGKRIGAEEALRQAERKISESETRAKAAQDIIGEE